MANLVNIRRAAATSFPNTMAIHTPRSRTRSRGVHHSGLILDTHFNQIWPWASLTKKRLRVSSQRTSLAFGIVDSSPQRAYRNADASSLPNPLVTSIYITNTPPFDSHRCLHLPFVGQVSQHILSIRTKSSGLDGERSSIQA
jgi:hypothetical protein